MTDNLGRLEKLEHKDNGALRAGYAWTHNANGWLTSMDFLPSGWNAEDATFTYDKNGQVTGVTRGGAGNESYSFDLNGNRTEVNGAAWTVGDDNRIDRDGTYEYQYDAERNLISRELLSTGATTEYAYDHRNRLVSVTEKTSAGTATKTVKYEYDVHDLRVLKSVDTDANGTSNRYEFYVWDGDDIVLDFVDADGGATPAAAFDKRYLWGQAVDQILAEETSAGFTVWDLADNLGSVRDLMDNTSELVSGSHVSYDAFGKLLSGTPVTRFAFTAQEWDADAGLYYYNARWYDPVTGKFVSIDPKGFGAGDANLGRYVNNSPTIAVDPTGLEKIWFEFNAFIPASHGVTFPTLPGSEEVEGKWVWAPDGWYYATDNRGFGGGTSRVYYRGWVESTALGRVQEGDWEAEHGTSGSKQVGYVAGQTRVGDVYISTLGVDLVTNTKQSDTKGGARVFNEDYVGTTIRVTASGGDPFLEPFAPNLDFTVDFNFSYDCNVPNKVRVSVNGIHDEYPNYEAIVTTGAASLDHPIMGTSLYQYAATGGGIWSLLIGLNSHTVSFGSKETTINATTPKW